MASLHRAETKPFKDIKKIMKRCSYGKAEKKIMKRCSYGNTILRCDCDQSVQRSVLSCSGGDPAGVLSLHQ